MAKKFPNENELLLDKVRNAKLYLDKGEYDTVSELLDSMERFLTIKE